MKLTKKDRRLRRATRARANIRETGTARLTVHRTPRHIYAQVTTPDGARVLAVASTVQEAVAKDLKGTGNASALPGRRSITVPASPVKAKSMVHASDREGRPLAGGR